MRHPGKGKRFQKIKKVSRCEAFADQLMTFIVAGVEVRSLLPSFLNPSIHTECYWRALVTLIDIGGILFWSMNTL